MIAEHTEIKDCYLLKPNIIKDDRGFFMESFNQQKFHEKTGLGVTFVQDNLSQSHYGVIRGLHGQSGAHAQAKLVTVLQGEVLDIAVDLRVDSSTYGKIYATVLNDTNRNQLFVPRGCLHGFAVLSQQATFFYKCDNYYNKESEYGVRYNDPSLGIDWKITADEQIISSKDSSLPYLNDLEL